MKFFNQVLLLTLMLSFSGFSQAQSRCQESLMDQNQVAASTDLSPEEQFSLRLEKSTAQIETLLTLSHSRRVDTEISEVLQNSAGPVLEQAGKLLQQNTQETSAILKKSSAQNALNLVLEAEKKLLRLGKLTSNSKTFMMKLMSLIPGLMGSKIRGLERALSKNHRELLDYQEEMSAENKLLVDLESKIKVQIQALDDQIRLFQGIVENLQNRQWDMERNANPSKAEESQLLSIKDAIRLADLQMKGLLEVRAVSTALQARANSVLDYNQQTSQKIFDLIKKDFSLVTGTANQKLNLDPDTKVQKTKPAKAPVANQEQVLKLESDFFDLMRKDRKSMSPVELQSEALAIIAPKLTDFYNAHGLKAMISNIQNEYQIIAIIALVKKGISHLYSGGNIVADIRSKHQSDAIVEIAPHLTDFYNAHGLETMISHIENEHQIIAIRALIKKGISQLYSASISIESMK